MQYIPVIGLEIHAELLTKAKVFCSCANTFGGSENSRVCPHCSALPGTLPVLNRDAVTLAARAGFALDCTVHERSSFDRKNYFYPDLPKAYQITQFFNPICTDGYVLLENGKKIRVNRIHIEEDAGKLVHDDYDGISMADYNRCGVPLIEIVTEPDFRSAEEAQDFVSQIALRLKYAGVCDGRMEQGSLRVDVNISLMPCGSVSFGTRAEIKNLNSLKSIRRAIAYEIERQSEILDTGGTVMQETRRFNDNHGNTKAMRSKEEAHDYRYFPEPDIPPIKLSKEDLEVIRASLPEMPQKRFARYTQEYGLTADDAKLLIGDKALSDFYDRSVSYYSDYRLTANLVLGELLRNIHDTGSSPDSLRFTPQHLADLVMMCAKGMVSKNAAKDILKLMFSEDSTPAQIAQRYDLLIQHDSDMLRAAVNRVLSENQQAVSDYFQGSQKIFGFLMGQVIRYAGKGTDPKLAKDMLIKQLAEKGGGSNANS